MSSWRPTPKSAMPLESAIKGIPDVQPWEWISYYLDKYDKFSVFSCSCRVTRRHMDEGCGQCTTKCKFDAIHLVRKYNTVPDSYEKLSIKMAANTVKRVGKIVATGVKEMRKKDN